MEIDENKNSKKLWEMMKMNRNQSILDLYVKFFPHLGQDEFLDIKNLTAMRTVSFLNS